MPRLDQPSRRERTSDMDLMLGLMIDSGVNGAGYFKLCEAGIDELGIVADQLREADAVAREKLRPGIHDRHIFDGVTHFTYKHWK